MKLIHQLFEHFPADQVFRFLTPFLMAVILPSAEYVIIASFFVFSDTLTGVLASRKKGQKFSSHRLFNTIPKLIAYGTAILIAGMIQWKFMPDFPCIKGITLFVVYIELKSIDENITTITGESMFNRIIHMINPKRDDR